MTVATWDVGAGAGVAAEPLAIRVGVGGVGAGAIGALATAGGATGVLLQAPKSAVRTTRVAQVLVFFTFATPVDAGRPIAYPPIAGI